MIRKLAIPQEAFRTFWYLRFSSERPKGVKAFLRKTGLNDARIEAVANLDNHRKRRQTGCLPL